MENSVFPKIGEIQVCNTATSIVIAYLTLDIVEPIKNWNAENCSKAWCREVLLSMLCNQPLESFLSACSEPTDLIHCTFQTNLTATLCIPVVFEVLQCLEMLHTASLGLTAAPNVTRVFFRGSTKGPNYQFLLSVDVPGIGPMQMPRASCTPGSAEWQNQTNCWLPASCWVRDNLHLYKRKPIISKSEPYNEMKLANFISQEFLPSCPTTAV